MEKQTLVWAHRGASGYAPENTLEAFQKHPNIDAIEVVCLEGWKEILKAYAKQFNIDKLKCCLLYTSPSPRDTR